MPDTNLTGFEVIGVESLEFGYHADVPTLMFWGSKVVASDGAGAGKPNQCREEPRLLLAPTKANSAYKVFGQTSDLSSCM